MSIPKVRPAVRLLMDNGSARVIFTFDGDAGGAFGTDETGTRTLGAVTARPGLLPSVRALRVRFTFLRGGAEDAYDLAVSR